MGRNLSIWVFMALLCMYGRKDIRYYRVGLMQSKLFGKQLLHVLIFLKKNHNQHKICRKRYMYMYYPALVMVLKLPFVLRYNLRENYQFA